MAQKRVEIYYSGNVQGVGFRFTADRLAPVFKIAGYVKNTPDGKVKIVAEGDEEKLKSFLTAVQNEMGHYVRDKEIDWSPPTGEFKDFGLKF
ncbi:MAG: acylphosphatase [Candidatus Margulisiibacteriota bacterium]